MCLRRTATGSIVVAESAASGTGTIPSGAPSVTEAGEKPPVRPMAGVPAKPEVMAESGESPGRSAAGFQIVAKSEAPGPKNPSEIDAWPAMCLTAPRATPKAPRGLDSTAHPAREKNALFG